MTTRSARLMVLTSISGRLIELRCIPGSIQRSKKTLSMELVAHMTMSAPSIASSGWPTGMTSTPSTARMAVAKPSRLRAKATDRLDVAHGAGRHQLRARLPAGAEKAEALRVGAGEVFYAEPIGRADAHALHDAVGQDRERRAVLHREQQHQSDIAVVGRRRDLFSTHGVAALGPSHDVGIDAHRADAELRRHAVHGFEAVERV